jgi:hypothetical protein
LQPRDGPFTRLVTAARRHFDNLVGPPARPHQEPANAAELPRRPNPQDGNPAQRPANVRGALQITPEEAAARLTAERQNQPDRQPHFWRDAFYWIEQSIALFLASLIPGVGERHVRAREDARREDQRRVEEQQRMAEGTTTTTSGSGPVDNNSQVDNRGGGEATSVQKSEVSTASHGDQGTSSSVQAREGEVDAAQMRNRG